jgi:hypothetical protein
MLCSRTIVARLSLLSLLATFAFSENSGDGPSGPCNNGGTTPPSCQAWDDCTGECIDPPGGSKINQFTGLYIHDAIVYQTSHIATGGCLTCGGKPSDIPANLPSLSLKRFYRSRNAEMSGSLGANHFLSTDMQLRLDWSSVDGTGRGPAPLRSLLGG